VLLYGGRHRQVDPARARRGAAGDWRCCARRPEAGRSCRTSLVDLFSATVAEVGGVLPGQLRAALVPTLLPIPPATAQDQLAVRLAIAGMLRQLAARHRYSSLDDVQWVDEPSIGVLSFVARRLEGVSVGFSPRNGSRTATPRRRNLCPEPCRAGPAADGHR
jgi:hypothetical protein